MEFDHSCGVSLLVMGVLYEFFFRRTCRGICLEISMVFWFDLIYSYTDLELRLIQFLRKPGGADETLRNWTCDACHAVGFTLAPGTTRLVRQAQRHAWCWMGNSRLMDLLFFLFFLKGMVKSKGTTFFCWVDGENLPAQRNILQLPSICLVG